MERTKAEKARRHEDHDAHPQFQHLGAHRHADVHAEPEPWLAGGLASFLLFIMLTEWIRPLAQLSAATGIYVIEPFVLAVFGFVSLDYLRLSAWFVWPLKMFMSWMLIGIFYYDSFFLDLSWWDRYAAVTARDAELLLAGNAALISGENRTMLLFIGLSLLVYALHGIIVRHQLCGWFIALTVVYLAVLQLAFGLNTTRGIIVSMCAGIVMGIVLQPVRWRNRMAAFAALGLRQPSGGVSASGALPTDSMAGSAFGTAADAARGFPPGAAFGPATGLRIGSADMSAVDFYADNQSGRSSFVRSGGNGVDWDVYAEGRSAFKTVKQASGIMGAVGIAAASMLAAWTASLHQPQVSDPVRWNVHEFLAEIAAFTHGNMPVVKRDLSPFARTGYPLQDYLLGSSVIPAHTPVFTARSDQLTYWRGESKSYYDGRGWSDGPAYDTVTEVLPPAAENPDASAAKASSGAIVQEVSLDRTAALFLDNIMFAGGQIVSVEEVESFGAERLGADEYAIKRSSHSGKYRVDAGDRMIASYRVEVIPIPHDGLDPRDVEQRFRDALGQGVSRPLTEREHAMYTQLPDRMSDRVYELAAMITENEYTDLAKARAIASYLRTHYEYDYAGSRPPAEHEEFVDHFLFEQRFGYCDHFSTAMVVLLRMNGIPARWVKGFAPGAVRLDETGKVVSEVRAEHAHSWVEAYIPEIGWVAFEPTPPDADSLQSAGIVQGSEDAPKESSNAEWWQGALTVLLSQANEEVEEMGGDWLAWIGRTLGDAVRYWTTDGREMYLWLGAGTLTAMGAAYLVWRLVLRHAIVRMRIERRMRMMDRRGGMAMMLDLLWQEIMRKHGPMKPGQTLREYVRTLNVRKPDQMKALMELAVLYEAIHYDERLPQRVSRGRMRRLWREVLG